MSYTNVRVNGDKNPKHFKEIGIQYQIEYEKFRLIALAQYGLDADVACKIARLFTELNIEYDKQANISESS